MLAGWDHSATLAALRLSPRAAVSNAMDRFDFEVRERIPDAGLDGMRALLQTTGGDAVSAGAAAVLKEIEELSGIGAWRELSMAPDAWAARLANIRGFFRPAVTESAD